MLILLGIAVGAVLALGFVPLVSAYGDQISAAAVSAVAGGAEWAIGLLPADALDGRLSAFLLVLLPLLAPPLTALLVGLALHATRGARRLLAVAIVVGGVVGMLFLGPRASLWLLGTAVVVAVLLYAVTGLLLELPLATFGSFLCVRTVLLVLDRDALLGDIGEQLADAATFGSPLVWRLIALASVVLATAAAFSALVRRR